MYVLNEIGFSCEESHEYHIFAQVMYTMLFIVINLVTGKKYV
jgi:hypothetical protein